MRPTSFSSNFVTYDLAGIKEKGVVCPCWRATMLAAASRARSNVPTRTRTRLAHEKTHEQVFSSPLGHEAAVNWVTCKDIAAVAAVALLDSSLDGSVHEYCVNAGI